MQRLRFVPLRGFIGLAAFCDLTITVPFLYYLLMVRSGRS